MKWKKLLTGAGALAVCAAAGKLLGALFRIPLTNIAGAEGIGLYQMVFPLYTALLTISSGGLSSAISKAVAGALSQKDEARALKIFKVAVFSLLVLGGAGALFLVLLRDRIAAVQGNPAASTAYLAIAPSLVFVAVISAVRGYFQGRGNMLPSGVSQIVEQGVKLVAGLFFAALFLKYGVQYAAAGAAIGVSLSELVAMAVLLVQFAFSYGKDKKRRMISVAKLWSLNNNAESGLDFAFDYADLPYKKEIFGANLDIALPSVNGAPKASRPATNSALRTPHSAPLKTAEILKSLYRIAIPITLGSLIMPLTQVIDSIMVINILTAGGMARGEATSLFGLVSGPISSLVNMPIVIMLSVSIALLPKIAYLRGMGESTDAAVGVGIRFTMLLALPAATVFMVFPRQIVGGLYSGGLTGWQLDISASLLRIESMSVFYVGIIQTATAVLQGADKPHRPAINLLYGAAIKAVLTLVLLPVFGIRGCAAASAACYAVIALLDLYYMRKIIRPKLGFVKTFLLPLIGCALLVGVALLGLWAFSQFMRPLFCLLFAFVAGALSYAGFLLITKTIKIKEFLK
ncbi:MAG: polysaccharide biosynthesis protein [Firmicutes bacterium]|nr:polysaccharide biosynthesis protein [Bacillota bacterium]